MKQIKSFNLTDEQIDMIRELSTAFQCSASEVVGRAIEFNYARYFKDMDKGSKC